MQAEVDDSLRASGMRPLARLEKLGIVSAGLLAVHATALSDEDIALLASRSATVVHCPSSNLKLASGFCPVVRLMESGVGVALR